MTLKAHLLAASAVAALAATGAPALAQQTPLTFQLNWTAGGANAGFAAALQEGYYEEAGLDVTIVQGNGSGNTAQLVASGQAQLAYADAVAVSQLIAKGAPMKVVSTIYQSNPNELIALSETGITSFEDLRGRTVGVPAGSSQTTMLPLLLQANGLAETDMQLLNMPLTSMVPSLMQGQVEAILGSLDSYAIQLRALGADIETFPFAEYGVPTVSTSIFASQGFIDENPEVLRAFIAASLRGWSFALDNPDEAVADVKELFPDSNPELVASELAAITPLFCSAEAQFIGKAEPAHWENTQNLLSQVGLLPEGQDPASYYTNEYLPADGDLRPCQ